MASSPVTAPSPSGNTNSPPSPSGTKDTSPPSSNSSSSSSPPPFSPPPSSPPPSSPPPSSPPPSSPPPSSPPPSSPPPSSPPPSSPPPPSTPAPKSPSPASPPPDLPSSPPPSGSPPSQSPPPTSGSPPPSSSSPPPNGSPPPASVNSPPAPPAFSSPTPPASPGQIPTPASGGELTPSPLGPPQFHMPPPSSSSSSSHESPDSQGSGGPPHKSSSSPSDIAIIAAIAVAGFVLLALVVICVACKKKKKQQQVYYPPPGEYYIASTQWHSPQNMNHVIKLNPPPGVMGTPPPNGGAWGTPPPPPPAMASSEFSSSYSGGGGGQLHSSLPPASPNMGLGFSSKSQFSYEELATATNGFSHANLLGQGGFGFVHKGVLPDGKEVAVKSLKSGSGQGEREFQAEVEIISRVHHRHLVSLVGYCIADGQRMLVYEFVPNNTLEHHLYKNLEVVMDWGSRLRIAVGSAKGLAYLHEDCHPRIIHRDIKAANILLDDNYEAMVADFGLAKLTSDNFSHVSTRVMGTFGYLAPEYASSGKLTEKSDVFSFGVMLLELITGRKPVDPTSKFMEDSLVDWARPLLSKALEDGNYVDLVDPRLEGNYAVNEIKRMAACAAASIRHSARRRPKMSQIVRALDGDSSLDDLNEGGAKSAQSGSSGQTEIYDTRAYNDDMVKFRQMVMTSQENDSSEYGLTSEYGLNPSSSSGDSREHSKH